jgi:hypothetical protein
VSAPGFIPTANALFQAMGIDEPLPQVDFVERPRDIDRNAYTEQERSWMREYEAAQLEDGQS